MTTYRACRATPWASLSRPWSVFLACTVVVMLLLHSVPYRGQQDMGPRARANSFDPIDEGSPTCEERFAWSNDATKNVCTRLVRNLTKELNHPNASDAAAYDYFSHRLLRHASNTFRQKTVYDTGCTFEALARGRRHALKTENMPLMQRFLDIESRLMDLCRNTMKTRPKRWRREHNLRCGRASPDAKSTESRYSAWHKERDAHIDELNSYLDTIFLLTSITYVAANHQLEPDVDYLRWEFAEVLRRFYVAGERESTKCAKELKKLAKDKDWKPETGMPNVCVGGKGDTVVLPFRPQHTYIQATKDHLGVIRAIVTLQFHVAYKTPPENCSLDDCLPPLSETQMYDAMTRPHLPNHLVWEHDTTAVAFTGTTSLIEWPEVLLRFWQSDIGDPATSTSAVHDVTWEAHVMRLHIAFRHAVSPILRPIFPVLARWLEDTADEEEIAYPARADECLNMDDDDSDHKSRNGLEDGSCPAHIAESTGGPARQWLHCKYCMVRQWFGLQNPGGTCAARPCGTKPLSFLCSIIVPVSRIVRFLGGQLAEALQDTFGEGCRTLEGNFGLLQQDQSASMGDMAVYHLTRWVCNKIEPAISFLRKIDFVGAQSCPEQDGTDSHVERAHAGFHRMFTPLWTSVLHSTQIVCDGMLQDPDRKCDLFEKPVWVAGHSLGGGLANLAARSAVLQHHASQVMLTTLAAPLVLNEAAARRLESASSKLHTFRAVVDGDIIAHVPFSGFLGYDYAHVGEAAHVRRSIDSFIPWILESMYHPTAKRHHDATAYQEVSEASESALTATPRHAVLVWTEALLSTLIYLVSNGGWALIAMVAVERWMMPWMENVCAPPLTHAGKSVLYEIYVGLGVRHVHARIGNGAHPFRLLAMGSAASVVAASLLFLMLPETWEGLSVLVVAIFWLWVGLIAKQLIPMTPPDWTLRWGLTASLFLAWSLWALPHGLSALVFVIAPLLAIVWRSWQHFLSVS